ncbi:MAG: hypothetical protein M0R06_10420 [Sphaerochaeta sp.]|jgi:hypothetical protein|nr:hypothetical protein [Sphaerochaeta sp.]
MKKLFVLQASGTNMGKHTTTQHYEFGLWLSENSARRAQGTLDKYSDETPGMYICEATPKTIQECINWMEEKNERGLALPSEYFGIKLETIRNSQK